MSEATTPAVGGDVNNYQAGLTSQPKAGQGVPFGQPEVPAVPADKPAPAAPEKEVPALVVGAVEPEKVEPNPSREEEFAYDPTGNASLDYALDFVGRLGYGPTHPAMLAARDGNFNLISAELAREGVRGADQVIALAKDAFAQEQAKVKQQQQELNGFAHEVAGGADNWAQVQSWASANADPNEKREINAALAAGGFQAKAAINFLVAQYAKTNTLAKAPAAVAKAGAAASRGEDSSGVLTAQEYGAAVQQLIFANGGRDVSGTREYADLQARRLAGRRAGL